MNRWDLISAVGCASPERDMAEGNRAEQTRGLIAIEILHSPAAGHARVELREVQPLGAGRPVVCPRQQELTVGLEQPAVTRRHAPRSQRSAVRVRTEAGALRAGACHDMSSSMWKAKRLIRKAKALPPLLTSTRTIHSGKCTDIQTCGCVCAGPHTPPPCAGRIRTRRQRRGGVHDDVR